MKNPIILLLCTICAIATNAQVGIGTTSPNSTLDVQGSLAAKTTVSTSTSNTLGSEYNFIYTGAGAATVTLPGATTIAGRMYTIKNASSSSLTVNTTSSQTIDGSLTYVMATQYQTVTVVSNGTNWSIIGYGIPSGSYWAQGGNNLSTEKELGTISNHELPIITNNTERMRFFTNSVGSVSIGSDTLDPDAPEKFRIDAGVTTSFNLLNAVGSRDGYLQMNVQNLSNGNNASTDIVATANNGTENSTYIDMGINSAGYTNSSSNILNGGNTAYLYANANDFYIGNGTTNKNLIFFTNTGAVGNSTANGTERLRISGAGNIGIANTNPTEKLSVSGNVLVGGNVLPDGSNRDLGSSAAKWKDIYATNGTIQTSDRRLKTNIHKLPYGLKEVMKLQPVEYNWKNDPNGNHKIGLIAQDVRQLIPEVVLGDETKENIGMNYAELVAVLVNAIKEQQQQIEELKKKVKRLEHK